MRIYSGTVKKGDFIYNRSAGDRKVKVPRLVRMHADEMNDIESASAGDIVAFFGIECASGDTFCDEDTNLTMTSMFVPAAVISLAVAPKDKAGQANFSKALNRFTKEDPTLRVHRDEESAQTIISGMGELHLEIYIERIKREYNCEVIAGKPQVAFRETITSRGEFLIFTPTRNKPGVPVNLPAFAEILNRCLRTALRLTNLLTTSRADPSQENLFPLAIKALKTKLKRVHSSDSLWSEFVAQLTTALTMMSTPLKWLSKLQPWRPLEKLIRGQNRLFLSRL